MESFPSRVRDGAATPLSHLAALLGIPSEDGWGTVLLRGVAPLRAATPDTIGFLAQRRYVEALEEARPGAVLAGEELASEAREAGFPVLAVRDPHLALARLLHHFHPTEPHDAEVHPTAVLGPGVKLGEGVSIAPYAVLEGGVEVGDGVRIGAHAVVGRGARIGASALLHPHVVIYPGTVVGEGVVLHAGVAVGVDGFGYAMVDGVLVAVPQMGRAVLEDGVEVGANATIDRGSLGDTRVLTGSKLDNLVQLGHNVTLGPHTVVAAQTGVSGSTRVGAGVQMGGQVGVGGHLSIGDGAQIAGQAGVTGDVEPHGVVMGFPARPRREFLRTAALQARLPRWVERLKELEERVEALEKGEGAGEES